MAHWQPVEQVAPQRRIGSTTSTTGPIEQAGPSLGRDPDVASDRLSTDGQSITACRSLAAPVIVNRAARSCSC